MKDGTRELTNNQWLLKADADKLPATYAELVTLLTGAGLPFGRTLLSDGWTIEPDSLNKAMFAPDAFITQLGLAPLDNPKVSDALRQMTFSAALLDKFGYTEGATPLLSALIDVMFPSGVISMWSGAESSIPQGWLLCDGTNGTPNLQNRFIVGAGDTYAVGDNGGANTVNVAHTHGYSGTTGASTSYMTEPVQGSSATFNSTVHTHPYSGTTGSMLSSALDIRPPYWALCYIMKS